MEANAAPPKNPFPAEAVATFGKEYPTCERLAYMVTAGEDLTDYLLAYPRDENRYGGAIGLRGEFGSGKTHVLTWLGNRARATKTINCTVLYGKCDSGRLFDLYQQLIEQLERNRIGELIQLAILNLARIKVLDAKVTESLFERLATVGGLEILQSEGNLDLQQLRQQLQVELSTRTAGSTEMAQVLLDIPLSKYGKDAYEWLSGRESEKSSELGVAKSLSSVSNDGQVSEELNAIAALEMIACLHRFAGVPFVILVDQLEILLRDTNASSATSLGSFLKKFVEQIGGQSAILFVAGLPEAWEKLPRDVAPRFRRRQQIKVGALRSDEINLLLDSYLGEQQAERSFTPTAVDEIHRLSGGSPREVLRIAHYAFEAVKGILANANELILLQCAESSGSIEDRARLAISAVNSVFAAMGECARELSANGQTIDCALLNGHEIVSALLIAKATDALDEIDAARRVAEVQVYLQEHWPQAGLVVVTVGYSSEEVRQLLSGIVTIPFDESDFESRLRSVALVSLRSRSGMGSASPNNDPSVAFDKGLSVLAERLENLESGRRTEMAVIQERFTTLAEKRSARAEAERQLKTRQDVLEAVDLLLDAVEEADWEAERKLARSIVIANEAYLHNRPLGELGDLFLDVLRLQRSLPENLLIDQLNEVCRHMRTLLRDEGNIPSWLRDPQTVLVTFGSLLAAFFVTGIVSVTQAGKSSPRLAVYLFLPTPTDFVSILPFILLGLLAAAIYGWLGVWLVRHYRWRRYQSLIKRLKFQIENYTPMGDRLSRSYPQAST